MTILAKARVTALLVSFLFFLSSISAPSVMAASSNSLPVALAPTPLSQLQANWVAGNANAYNWNYNPQNQINSSNAQYLGLSWLFPLPTHPTALLSVAGGLGVDTAPLIVNGTIYFITQFAQVFALNAANGNVLWTDVLPIFPNSTAGKGIGAVSLHLHDGNEAFTTALFNHTPTFWVSAMDQKVYAINALNGKYELNFSAFDGINTVAGNNPGAIYGDLATPILVDQQRGIVITSIVSGSSAATGRCFYRGWNILMTPVQLMWTTFCTPPQPGGSLPVDPNWTVNMVNGLKGAQIFYPGPAYNGGGPMPGTAVVDLKKLSAAQLNATLYDDWGQVNQTPQCKTITGGGSVGSTTAGWGSPWLLGTGPTSGWAFVNTNNRDPYNSMCSLGPSLWSASVLALDETTGQWIWGFQTAAHEVWDYDCSWWQALGNETVNGANTQVLWKTCKSGYLFELNAQTGAMIWAWTPPINILQRCDHCFLFNPLNKTQMNYPYFAPERLASNQPTLCTPCSFAFESESAYDPKLNYLITVSDNNPRNTYYVPMNTTNYKTTPGWAQVPPPGQTATEGTFNNATVEAVNAATGQMVWSHLILTQGYRGGVSTSGNIVFLTLSSGDLLMLNGQTGNVVKDYFIGGPLNVLPSIGATSTGQMEVIVPITAGSVSWGTGVPGDIVALTLQNVPSATTNTITSTSTISVAPLTTTSTTTITSAGPAGVSSTTLYGVAAVAVIFIVATGFLAMRNRPKPAM